MNQSNVDLLDLPNEMLLNIFKKLDNAYVLYSLFGVINERFDNLLQDNIFTNTLNLFTESADTYTSFADRIDAEPSVDILTDIDEDLSLADPILNRFCIDILPRIYYNVKHLIV